jgi:predicted ATPase/class 3 adenylate cyclase/DNA-binding CsgD family transcriptional regulator
MDTPRPAAGLVTFLLSDVVASTRLWQRSPLAGKALARQAELIAEAIAEHGGFRPPDQGEGDSTLSVFSRPAAALAAALAAQRALLAEPWPDGATVSVRMAVHTGEAEVADSGNYGGLAIIRAARLRGLAKGGQVLVSSATAALVGDSLPDSASLAELGSVVLPGFERPERVHQLTHAELPIQPGRLGTLQPSGTSALGAWPTPLIGRERERREVGELLTKGRLVTITGAGGSGKTRLAHAVAQDSAELLVDGVVWVELARVSDGAQIAAAVVAACGLAEVPGATSLQVLSHRLAKSDLLIVLDNCEHLLGACAELADVLLRAGPEVRVVATAREPLGVTGEVMWRIPSLSVPAEDEHSLERIAAADAVQLFVERARASRPDFALDPANAPIVAAICRRLDGIPLALELAAARVRALSIDRLATGLDDRFRLLTGGARTAVARQRTLLASVEWSYDLLSDDEQALFRRLAVFASPFSLEAAEAVAAGDDLDRLDVFDLLARLVDKSLAQHGSDRYRMLETLRHFGLERADDAGELELVRDRHLAWFRRRSAGWAVDREIFCEPGAAEIETETPDLIAALDWSLGRDRTATLELLQPLGATWPTRLANDEARAVSSRVLRGLEVGGGEWLESVAPIAGALALAGDVATLFAARAALPERREAISATARCQLETALSFLLAFFEFDAGIRGIMRSVEDARALGNRTLEVLATMHLAMMSNLSDSHRARRLADWLDRQLPADATLRPNLRFIQVGLALNEGDFATARATIARTHPSSLIHMVQIALATGDRTLLRDALALLDGFGAPGMFEGMRDLVLGAAAVVDGDFETARGHLRKAAEMPGFISYWMARNHLARAARAVGDQVEADALLAEAERAFADSEMHFTRVSLDLSRGHRIRRQSAAESEALVHAALARAIQCGYVLAEVDALELLALIHGDADRLADAARLIGAANAFRARSGYKQLYPMPDLDELRGRLDSDAVAEGASLSLQEAVEYARRGRGERSRPDHGWDSLTPTESRVVELVASGLPNKEIAQKLFVSLATVKTHLVHVFTKLDVRSRTELAAAATRRAGASRRSQSA